MKNPIFLAATLWLAAVSMAHAQFPRAGGGPGHFYGKIVDENNRGVGYATVRLFGKVFNPATRTAKDTLLAGQLTADNGDFSFEKLPVVGDFELVVSFLGYTDVKRTVSFGIKPPSGEGRPGGQPGGRPGGQSGGKPGGGSGEFSGGQGGGGFGGGNFEKDLGNIRLVEDGKTMKEVTVTAKAQATTLALDRKSYRVDKDLTSAGGTAQDALKNVPSLSVDLDGNVSLRNSSPQIFVDGRPTTLTLDQIPASSIESVEVITNPSAKFDAGGGPGGIVNIVLKKELRLGYNGNVRTGADSKGGFNLGGDLNARGGKFNLFGSANINQNRGNGDGTTVRQNLFAPPSTVTQESENKMLGLFANGRAGVDWLIDNRNTLTLSGNLTRGHFQPSDDITTTTEYPLSSAPPISYLRSTANERAFWNLGTSAQFKHLFPKKGREWTADLNLNRVRFRGNSHFETDYASTGEMNFEKQEARGRGQFVTAQTDFVNPINERTKIEGGLKSTLRTNFNDNTSYKLDEADVWQPVHQISDHYKFNDDVFAAYLQGSHQRGDWGFQAGLRAESSYYRGALTDRDSSFTIVYPVSLFPSAFVTRKLNDGGDQLQLAYTRRVNRPNFFQTMPFTDFSDSLNLRRGNPKLLPEFNNSVELSYQNLFGNGQNLVVSVYAKEATNVISTYQFTEFNSDLNKEVVVTGYANGDRAAAYGAEITLKNTLFGLLDLTSNLNVYQSQVDATNVEASLKTDRMSAFLKETVQLRLPQKFTVQLNGEYRTRASFTPVTNNDPFSRGPGGGGPQQNTAQGYTKPVWFVDASLKREFWKNQASVTLSVQDVFASRRFGSLTTTDFFTQDTERIQNPQLVRLNFSYRFGKMDASLFNRKNTRQNAQGGDMM